MNLFFWNAHFSVREHSQQTQKKCLMKQNWKGESGQHDNQLDSVKIRNTAGHLYCSGCLQKRIQSLKIYFRYFFCWIQAGPTMSYAHIEACIHVDTVHICLTWCNAHNWIKLHIRKLSISEIYQYIKTCTILSIKLGLFCITLGKEQMFPWAVDPMRSLLQWNRWLVLCLLYVQSDWGFSGYQGQSFFWIFEVYFGIFIPMKQVSNCLQDNIIA